jgi:hypothetical protein
MEPPVRGPDDGTTVTLHWLEAASDLPIVGYRATAEPGGQFCTTDGALFCTITGLTPSVSYSFTVVARNAVGTSEPSDPVALPSDTTAPTVTYAYSRKPLRIGDTDWFAGPVDVTWNVTDNEGGSGVPEANVPAPITVTASQQVSSGAVCDAFGNCATTTTDVGIDTTGPDITITDVVAGHKYPLGTGPTPACVATDSGSGVATGCHTRVSGGNANGVGTFTVTATATDRLGNTTTETLQYRVVYQWGGFFQPIDDPVRQADADVSVFKAGSGIPVRFALTGPDGQVIRPVSAPTWLTPTKGAATSLPVDETVHSLPGDSGLTYRFTDDRWQYNWRTDGEQAEFYWRIGVRLDDGETHHVTIALR